MDKHKHKWEMTHGRRPKFNDGTEDDKNPFAWLCTDRKDGVCANKAIVGCYCGAGLCVGCIPDGDPNEVA